MIRFIAGASWKLPQIIIGFTFWAGTIWFVPAFADTSTDSNNANLDLPDLIKIPAGAFIAGSSKEERRDAYDLDAAAYGHDVTRRNRWYENEFDFRKRQTTAFEIATTPITNAQYRTFIRNNKRPAPSISEVNWKSFGLVHPFTRVGKYLWDGNQPPAGRDMHPVVLVNFHDATAYAEWLTEATGDKWRLPTEVEWEKAARGINGNIFPWGNVFKPELINSHDKGPFDTQPVGRYTAGKSPFGMLDAAGQVYEWTADLSGVEGAIVKGGSWDDKGCGVCRPAARHTRPMHLKHIIIGFRVVREPKPMVNSIFQKADTKTL